MAKAARLKSNIRWWKPFIPPPEVVKEAPELVEQEKHSMKPSAMGSCRSLDCRQQLEQRQQELSRGKVLVMPVAAQRL